MNVARYGMMAAMGHHVDPTYILVIIGMLICMLASAVMQYTFMKYSTVKIESQFTGAQVAQMILEQNGLSDVRVEQVGGKLTDHYDPANKVVRLSEVTYGARNASAVGVAAHECGHAIQHAWGYKPLDVRTALVPFANFGSKYGIFFIVICVALGLNPKLIAIGIAFFFVAVLFHFVTLPVEIDASKRALHMLNEYGIVTSEESTFVKKVLTAAAMTYVASAASSLLQLLRLLLIFGGKKRRK